MAEGAVSGAAGGSKARVTGLKNSSRAGRIAAVASQIFLALVLLQVPLFRVPCKSGLCKSPLELTAVQLASSRAAPPRVVKAILFPGACVRHLVTDMTLPSWNNLLEEYNMTDLEGPSSAEILRLEVIAGSYFSVAGALVGVFKPGRMSMFGMLLIVWGLMKEGLFSKQGNTNVQATPILIFALALAFLSVKYDFQKVQNIARPVMKPLKSSSKSKLK